MIEPIRIVDRPEMTLFGRSLTVSYSNYQVAPLWKALRTDLAKMGANDQPAFYSVQVYPPDTEPNKLTPQTSFTYWAGIKERVEGVEMNELVIPVGVYAVFTHKGTAATFSQTARAIHTQWMPQSSYRVDDRPHFEVLGEKYYGPMNPDSEEEVFIPITAAKQ